jgi:hypothetical protein
MCSKRAGGEMCHILLVHRIPLCLELLNRRGYVNRVPDHHAIREGIEGAGHP